MKITVIAVGKLKEKFWKDAIAEYAKRLSSYATVRMLEVTDYDPAKCGGEEAARIREGNDLLAVIPPNSHVILLAIEAPERSSEQFAAHLDDLTLHGTSDICFLIGGSCGVSESVKARANESTSFGPITLPHNLARVVLYEQLYRSFRILRGEPYHK